MKEAKPTGPLESTKPGEKEAKAKPTKAKAEGPIAEIKPLESMGGLLAAESEPKAKPTEPTKRSQALHFPRGSLFASDFGC